MKLFRRTWPYILLAVLLLVNVIAWTQRENIADWVRLRNYNPPKDIAALAADATMTDLAKHLFYINHPSLEDKDNFNKHCSDESPETAVLGCFRGNRQGIYLYAVTDPRLEGVRQVTAAHEMLHQAYERLNPKERQRLSRLLNNYYTDNLADQTVISKLDSYKKQPGTDLVNEMHSIFGTEVRNLPAELEAYYKQYFSDRSKVVSTREAYQAEFTRRQELVTQYDSRLSQLKKKIKDNKAVLEQEMNFLNAKEKEIDQDINSSNQAAYESDVQEYNSAVAQYNTLLVATRDLISEHNDTVIKRNDIAVQEQELHQALDSSLGNPASKQ